MFFEHFRGCEHLVEGDTRAGGDVEQRLTFPSLDLAFGHDLAQALDDAADLTP